MDVSDPTWWPIARLLEAYRTRAVSAVEVLEATSARVETTEPTVHAYASLMIEAARAQAAKADEATRRGALLGTLHGVPIAVKDLVFTAGHPTEAGSASMEGFVPDDDAEVVRRLRDAGALIVGKSVTHEFALGANVVETNNAWDPSCYSGGSSAGSGVAVAVGSAHGAIGSDTGGSVRVPAALNGIVGLKPTYGRVSRDGVVPLAPSLDAVGPLARSVEDCAVLLGAIAGRDGTDPTAADRPVPPYTRELAGPVEGMRVGIDRRSFLGDGVEDGVASAVEAAIGELERLGAVVVPVEIPHVDVFVATGLATMVAEAAEHHHHPIRRHAGLYSPESRLAIGLGDILPAAAYVKAQKVRGLIRRDIRAVFEGVRLDAFAAPTLPVATMPLAAWRSADNPRGEPAIRSCMRHGLAANLTGMPSLSVPVGFDRDDHPVGMQLLGRPFSESALLRLGHAYQRVTSWHEAHPRWLETV